MGNIIGRDALLATKSKLRTRTVLPPGCDGEVIVRELNVDQMFQLRARLVELGDKNLADQAKLWVVYCAVDADGKPILEDTPETMTALAELPGQVVRTISDAAILVNSPSREELIKNSETSPNGDSSSVSLPISA